MKKLLFTILLSFAAPLQGMSELEKQLVFYRDPNESNHSALITFKVIKIKHSPYLFNNLDMVKLILTRACKKAVKEDIFIQEGYLVEDIFTFFFQGNKGYIVMVIDDEKTECQIGFLCQDKSYDFNKFQQYLLKYWYRYERCGTPDIRIE